MTYIESAKTIIAHKANRYKPKNKANWICFYSSDSAYSETYEPSNSETYCEDCIEKAVEKLNKDPSAVFPKNFEGFTYDTETSKEGEDFCCCDSCGEIIRQSIILTRQEVSHWLKLTDLDYQKGLNDNRFCYELLEILSEAGEYKELITQIAKKIIKNSI